MSRDPNERRHRKTWRNAASIEIMANADFDTGLSLSAAMGLLRCIHGEEFPCCQCKANRAWNEASARKKMTEAEFEALYTIQEEPR
jgi:hypothetical protein